MLKYLRSKQVSVELAPPDALRVFGVLDDNLYGVELEALFRLGSLEIQSVTGKWHRYTTPACPLALDHLQEAVGMRVGPGFRAGLQKGLGRKGCRHFANLLIEMGHAAKSAVLLMGYHKALAENPSLTLAEFHRQTPETVAVSPPLRTEAAQPSSPKPASEVKKKAPAPAEAPKNALRAAGGLVIDMHVHTIPASPCSTISVDDLIAEAQAAGLGGLVLTDHNHVWAREEIDNLRQKHGFLVLAGNEIITDQGDVLVYGYQRPVTGVISLGDLRKEVLAAGGFMTAAHPFRGFLIFGAQQLGLTVEKAAQREMFKHVDAVEVLNGKVTADENEFAGSVAEYIGLPGIAGSDAHETGSVGRYATEFEDAITCEDDLVAALHAGRFRPVVFR